MKKVTAYVNTMRVHWLVEELQAAGIGEIIVTEHFKPLSQISRIELLCEERMVRAVKSIVHRLGSTGGSPPDHDIVVSNHDPQRLQLLPMTTRLDELEESRLKQLITNIFAHFSKRLTLTFAMVVLSILSIALILHGRLETIQQTAEEANRNVWLITDATHQIEKAHLDQLLAAERLHRGDTQSALDQSARAQKRLAQAERVLINSHLYEQAVLDSLRVVEHDFRSVIEDMVTALTGLADAGKKNDAARVAHLSLSHADVMSKLDKLSLKSMQMLTTLEQRANDFWAEREAEATEALSTMKLLLLVLMATSIAVTLVMWLMARRKVSHPLQMIVEEGKTLDMEGLK
ncbi:MAG: hypothetical protein HY961_14550 [Ignavibacteriae bacterium]|nr:hypothetical protein [Ignavibacteriota bacterium]